MKRVSELNTEEAGAGIPSTPPPPSTHLYHTRGHKAQHQDLEPEWGEKQMSFPCPAASAFQDFQENTCPVFLPFQSPPSLAPGFGVCSVEGSAGEAPEAQCVQATSVFPKADRLSAIQGMRLYFLSLAIFRACCCQGGEGPEGPEVGCGVSRDPWSCRG